jgi:hypothetical protein
MAALRVLCVFVVNSVLIRACRAAGLRRAQSSRLAEADPFAVKPRTGRIPAPIETRLPAGEIQSPRP